MRRDKELLLWAAENGFDALAEKVIKKYPDIMEIKDGKEIVLHSFRSSVLNGHPRIVELLISEFPEIAESSEAKYALIPTSYYGREDILDILLKTTPDIINSEEAEIALRWSASRNNENIFNKLIEARPHILDSDIARGGIILAAKEGHDNIVSAYFKAKPEIANTKESSDALYWATSLNRHSTAELIKVEMAKAKFIKNIETIKRRFSRNPKIKELTIKLSDLVNKLEKPNDIIRINDILESIINRTKVRITKDSVDSEFLHIIFTKRANNFPKEISERIANEISGPFTVLKNIQKEINR